MAAWTVHRRRAVLFVALCTVLCTALGVFRLEINSDPRAFFGPRNPQYRAFTEFEQTFGRVERLFFLLAPEDGEVFTRQTLDALGGLAEEAWQIPYAVRVYSLSNFHYTRSEEGSVLLEDLISDPATLSDGDLLAVRAAALSQGAVEQRLVSPDGRVACIQIELDPPDDAPQVPPSIAAAAEEIRAGFRARHPGIDIRLTGSIMIAEAFSEASRRDLRTLVPLMFAVMAIVMAVFLQSASRMLAATATVLASMLTGIGLAGWLGIPMTAVSVSAPGLIITLAVADCVHLLSAFKGNLYLGMKRDEACILAVQDHFRPVFLTSFTTIIGFLCLNFSESPPFRALGNMVAIGVAAAFIYSVLLLPALMASLPARRPLSPALIDRRRMRRLAAWVVAHPRLLRFALLAAAIPAAAGLWRIEFNDNFITYFGRSFELRRDSDFMIEHLRGWDVIDYALAADDAGGVMDPAYLDIVDQFAAWYREQPRVVHVTTLADTVKRLHADFHGGDAAFQAIPGSRELIAQYLLLYELSLPAGMEMRHLVNIDRTLSRVHVTLESLSAREVRDLDRSAKQWLRAHAPPAMHVEGTGLSVIWAHITQRNIRSMLAGSLAALLLVSLTIALTLRDLRLGLVSLIANLMPPIMAFGLWGLTRGRFGLALSVVFAMTIGIIVDDTIHFLTHYQRCRREPGMDAATAVRHTFETVGTALCVTTIALTCGFLVLTLSPYRMSAEVGMMCAAIIGLALAFDLLLLPALLLLNLRVKPRRPPAVTARCALDRMGTRGFRPVSLPHHRTCGFPHPAVEPGEGHGCASAESHGMTNP